MSLEQLAQQEPEVIRAMYRFKNEVFKDNALSFKEKELIAVAVTAVMRCDECFRLHSQKAMELGATKEEVRESILVAMYLTGPSAGIGIPSMNQLLAL